MWFVEVALVCVVVLVSSLLVYLAYIYLLQSKSIKLYYASQNFGLALNDTKHTILDANNSAFFELMHNDIISFQELLIPSSRWTNPTVGITETFSLRDDTRFGFFAATANTSIEVNKEKYLKSYGIFINPNLNFNITHIEDINMLIESEYKGGVVVTGKLYDLYNVAFVGVHLIWDNKTGYSNPSNIKLVEKILIYINTLKLDYFIILGDFNIRFSEFKNVCLPIFKKIVPKIFSEVDDMESSLITCFDKDGFAHPDHILTNLKINSFRTRLYSATDHCSIYGSLAIPVPKYKKIILNKPSSYVIKFPEKNK